MRSNGLTLGVLGGMGPAATAEFQRLLAELAPAQRDQEHPKMIVLSQTATPDRTSYIIGKGENPTPYIREGLENLISWGADLLATTCNTAHFFIDQFREELSRPVVHIIEETIKESNQRSAKGAWLTATLGTMNSGLYQKHAAKFGYEFRIPSVEMQQEIHDITNLVKEGKTKESGERYRAAIEELWKIEKLPVVGACTELPIAYAATGLPEEMGISSLEALAKGCIRELYKPL